MITDFNLLIFSSPLAAVDIGLPETAALAAVALIGYLFGHRTRKNELAAFDAERLRELERAAGIARQLETIAGSLRQDLANHHSQLAGFKRRLNQAQESDSDRAWQLVCSEAEAILAPTMQLAEQLSLAYDSIRQQSHALETFSQARTDPETGIANARALEQRLDVLFASATTERYRVLRGVRLLRSRFLRRPFSKRTASLAELARLIQACVRGSDFVARYGEEELVVVMPQTKLAGACIFAERLRGWVVSRLSATVSCGIAEYHMNDDKKSLLGRADSAFYSAKAAGGNCQFVHTGSQIREFRGANPSRPVELGKLPSGDGDGSLGARLVPATSDSLSLGNGWSADSRV